MDCQKVEELISMYIEDELSEELKKEVSLHLEQCHRCRQLKDEVEQLLYVFPDLEEDVPFFLKNRLYYIPESQEVEEVPETRFYYLKWIAAVVGTFVLFLNLFYFTNIYPPANRLMHSVVSKVETFAVQTGAFIEKVKESRDLLVSALFNSDSDKDSDSQPDEAAIESQQEDRDIRQGQNRDKLKKRDEKEKETSIQMKDDPLTNQEDPKDGGKK